MQEEFLNWLIEDGGLVYLALIAVGLFAVQTVFSFLLWRKGDKKYFFNFIVYAIAAATIMIGIIAYVGGLMDNIISEETFTGIAAFFIVAACIAGGIQIFFFIRDTWLKKEAKT